MNKKRFFAGPDSMDKEELVGDMRAGGSLGCQGVTKALWS